MTNPHRVVLAALLIVTSGLQASADVKLDLAVHEVARAARKQGFEKLLVVVREDLRSARDQEIGGVLRTLERQTVEALTAEPRVSPLTSRSVRIKAHSAKARAAMTPQEVATFQGDTEADAILSVDYQKRRTAGVRMTLVNSQAVFFAESVRLSARPEPDDDLFEAAFEAADSDDTDSESDESTEEEEAEDADTEKEASPGPTKPQSPGPSPASAGTGKPEFAPSAMRMRRDPGEGDARSIMNRLVRSSPRARQIIALILMMLEEEERRIRASEGDGESDTETAEGRPRAGCPCDKESNTESGEGEERQGPNGRNCPRREGERGEEGTENADGKCCRCCNKDGETREETDGEENEEEEPIDPLRFGELPPLNEAVLNFASNNLGNQIGRGECWDLADQALRNAGAEPARGYTFGDRVDLDEVIPGDILQFTSVRIDEPGYWLLMGTPNHTAVVQAVGEERLFILQQNFDGKRYVTTYDFNPNSMTRGTLEAFRPRPPRN